jgi:hypothetical protein
MTHVLQPPGASHPWPRTIPSSRFGQLLPSQPVTYTKVKPRVVLELDVDGSFDDEPMAPRLPLRAHPSRPEGRRPARSHR